MLKFFEFLNLFYLYYTCLPACILEFPQIFRSIGLVLNEKLNKYFRFLKNEILRIFFYPFSSIGAENDKKKKKTVRDAMN